MRSFLIAGFFAVSLLGSFSAVQAQGYSRSRSNNRPPQSNYNQKRAQTYNRNMGYSDRVGNMGNRGSSAPYQGNFRFAPGYGYGSIYGNSHPGFNTFTGPSWASPYAWGN